MLTYLNWRYLILVPNPFPIKTFPERLIIKWRYIVRIIVDPIGTRLGFYGARVLGVTPTGSTLLQLNKDYALGCKGTILELPKDHFIYKDVKNKGSWDLMESKFLAQGLRKACQQAHSKTALIDIGANTGLITLQAMNLSNTTNEVFLFEPIPRHASAIKQNLRNLSNVHVNEFALSDVNGKAEIFTEATNHVNTSLFKSVVPKTGMVSTQVRLVETTEYCEKFLKSFNSFVIKCDTQGMDALILSRFPEWIWKNCVSAHIEVWSLNETSKKDVDGLLSKCQEFDLVSWRLNATIGGVELGREVELDEVREFWLSKSGSFRNLFLSKNI